MTDISIQKIVKAFEEGKNILDGVTFDITAGERVGLLGRNGAGKTTLFRIICGEISEDSGEVVIASGRRIGLISQIPVYPPDFTTEDVLHSAFDAARVVSERMRELEAEMESNYSDKILREYDALQAEFARLGGYDTDFEVQRVANGLGIPAEQMKQLFDTLSGGEKTRANLARLILEDTDILLLDEPTNHLDMNSVEWLEDYLAKFKGTVLVISHDRYFLDKVVTRTIEIFNGKAEFYSGNYSFYVVEKERRYQEQLARYEREQAEAKRLQAAADRLYQWGTQHEKMIKRSQAIEKRIERLVQTGRPQKDKQIGARFGEQGFRGDEVLIAKGVSKAYGEKKLFSEVMLEVTGGERIALIGDNGAGKTTLIKLIMGDEKSDSGYIRTGPSVKKAYLPQIVTFDDPHASILQTVISECGCSAQTARNRLGAFRFFGEDVFKRVADLSGGEQSRLRMCILMHDEINLLILDEPTNHMDIAAREWIEEAVKEYGEALLFVSHDRYFINKFATRIWELENGVLTDYRCSFADYRALKAAQKQSPVNSAAQKKTEHKAKQKKQQSPEKLLAKLEREISALEEEISRIEAQREEFSTDYQRLMELDEEAAQLTGQLDSKYLEWETIAEEQ